MFLLSQILGVIATLFSCIAIFNSNNRKLFYIFEIFFCVLYAISLACVSAWTGMILMIIGTVRMLTFLIYEKLNKQKPVFLLVFFQAVTLFSTLFTCTHWTSILLLIIAIIYVWAIWQDKQLPLLIVTMIYSLCNILYNFYSNAFTCVLLELVILISTIITILKLAKSKRMLASNI